MTGRIASIKLPTGGTISYTYSGGPSNTGILADGSTPALTRTVSDGTTSQTWSYVRNGNQTTVTDPDGNQTVYTFSGNYETQRQVYALKNGSQVLQRTILTCYNGNFTSCNSATVSLPITRLSVFTTLENGRWNEVDSYFNSNGLLYDNYVYDFTASGNPPLLQRELISYANDPGQQALGNNINDRPTAVSILDGAGNYYSQTLIQYDEPAYCCASAAAAPVQHAAVNGSRGNATSISHWSGSANGANTYLTEHISYDDTGSVTSVTDANRATTTFNYGTDLNANCQNAFPTSVTLPTVNGIAMTKSMSWNCNGAVMTTTQDVNGKQTQVKFDDPNFWRPTKTFDQLLNETDFYYPSSAPYNWGESSFIFNGGNSVHDVRTTVDALGRTSISQLKQSSSASSYESTQVFYDEMGRPKQTTMPFVSAAGIGGGNPVTTTLYDGLSRPAQVTDVGGGIVMYDYYDNDILVTGGPAASGENVKKAQYEYDALGRLTSVCEITNGPGAGTCGQSRQQAGYWTRYQYDPTGRLTGICQYTSVPSGSDCVQNPSAGQQTRKFAYDPMGRMTDEWEPETGHTQYVYDFDAACSGQAFPGDLVKKVDQANNVTCYNYDLLHRVTLVTYPSGSNAGNTPSKGFIYDVWNGPPSVANIKGRLVAAYTCNPSTCATSWLTAELFSYSDRGELTDFYETTPHSGSTYHTSLSYWPDGTPQTLSTSYGLPSITYGAIDGSGLDGEGRVTKVAASSGQNPVTAVNYDNNDNSQPIGALTKLTLGSGDSDNFSYDTLTGRLTQYKFNVGSASTGVQSVAGNLSWNPNGSLGGLNITDPLNPSNGQNCNYYRDDLSRVSAGYCYIPSSQTSWNQWFNYDPFGNITQNGNVYFNPGYDSATNRMVNNPNQVGPLPIYDADGNLTSDTIHSYSWDAEGRPTTVDYVTSTYDAFGRVVEQAVNLGCAPFYKQVVYAPSGDKLALMNGQIIQRAFVPLPGGATAVYGSPILNHMASLMLYQHSDWLGSSRLDSSPTQQWLYDGAYGLFGQTYSESAANGGLVDRSFTGENQDTVPGLYDFMFREYSPLEGRWISPDPLGMGAADPTDPQTLNLYGYVGNDPLSATDPDGLDFVYNGGGGGGNGGGSGGFFGSLFGGLFGWLGSLFGGGGGSGGLGMGGGPGIGGFGIGPGIGGPGGGIGMPSVPTPVFHALQNFKQFNENVASGSLKEIGNTGIGLVNMTMLSVALHHAIDAPTPTSFFALSYAVHHQIPQFEASNGTQKWTMRGVFVASLFVPGEGEEQGAVALGGKGEEILTRFGTYEESVARLSRKANEAVEGLGIHGISASTGPVEEGADVSRASRTLVERFFKVHDTPSAKDPFHKTIELPNPITKEVADTLNRLFGRPIK